MIYFRYDYTNIGNFTLKCNFICSIYIHLATEEKLTDTFNGRREKEEMTETVNH